jgi:hypothetical protein
MQVHLRKSNSAILICGDEIKTEEVQGSIRWGTRTDVHAVRIAFGTGRRTGSDSDPINFINPENIENID